MRYYKKIIIHIAIWSFLILVLNSKTIDFEWGAFDRKNGSLIIPLIYGMTFGAFIFYLNINHYIPKFFGKENKRHYWLYATLLLLGISLLEGTIDIAYLISQNYELAKIQFREEPRSVLLQWVLMITSTALVGNIACWILAFAYKLPKDWLINEKQKNQLEKDKLRTELNFLKAQINPHFLFNGINSIYHLIGVDNKTAKNTLLQFSGLLRYQLYDCGVNFIALEKELEYISNYLNIEEVRKGEDAVFKFKLPNIIENESLKKYKVSPLLITPFLENAFKYLSHYSDTKKNFINLDLKISEKGILNMELSNSFDYKFKMSVENKGGIGLENVKRRLDILYPEEKHTLEINKSDNVFLVNLILNLNEN
jgi:hypothetical protein